MRAVETNYLDLQHHSCLLTLNNKLYLCPAGKDDKPFNRVLDAGCGTGIWAMDFGMPHDQLGQLSRGAISNSPLLTEHSG